MLSGNLLGPAQSGGPQNAERTDPLYQEANELEKRGDYPAALAKYEASLKAAEARGDRRAVAKNWLGIGSIKMVQGDYPKALEWCQRAAQTAQELDDASILSGAWLRMGNIQEGRCLTRISS